MTPAARQRRRRERRRCGLRVVPLEVDEEAIEELIASGAISEADLADREQLAQTLGELFANLLRHA